MDRYPLFSIVIPVYNDYSKLNRPLDSLRKQIYRDFEVVVVDDGSDVVDGSFMNKFPDLAIKFLKRYNNGGEGAARNTGIDAASGVYICFLDSDDAYMPNHLSDLAAKIKGNNYPVVFYKTGVILKTDHKSKKIPPHANDPARNYFDHHAVINSFCVHHEILKEIRFLEDSNHWVDYHFVIRLFHMYKFALLADCTAIYHASRKADHYESYSEMDNAYNEQLKSIEDLERRFVGSTKLSKNDFKRAKLRTCFHLAYYAYLDKKYAWGVRLLRTVLFNPIDVRLYVSALKLRLQILFKQLIIDN